MAAQTEDSACVTVLGLYARAHVGCREVYSFEGRLTGVPALQTHYNYKRSGAKAGSTLRHRLFGPCASAPGSIYAGAKIVRGHGAAVCGRCS